MSVEATLLEKLTKLELFSTLDDTELHRAFGPETRLKTLARRGRMSLDEGGDNVYAIAEGLGKTIRTSRTGRQIVDKLLRAGDVFGRLFLEGPKRVAEFEAVSDCTVLTLRASDVRAILEKHPAAMRTYVELLEERERRLSRRVESLVFDDVMMRVVEMLFQLTIHIPEECKYGGFAVDLRVTQSDLAELIGASRQAVNRVLKSLESDDVLHRHDGVLCVQDVKRLKSMIDGM